VAADLANRRFDSDNLADNSLSPPPQHRRSVKSQKSE